MAKRSRGDEKVRRRSEGTAKKRLAVEGTIETNAKEGDKMEYRENRDARRPFLSTPDSRVYFPAAAIEEARRSTARCLRRNEGVALVVGATGTGKTLLTRVLAAEFEAESLVAVVSPTRRIDAKSFWQQFLFSLRQTFCGCDETELRLMALDYLERSQRRRCVLLIDDAQNLPFRVFDELRSFVDQGAAAASQVSVALFGTTVLEERLNLPPLYPFHQRIVSRSYLDAFESAEIADYIDCETRRVAGNFLFTTDAKRKVADFCKGSPRIANQLCDRALFLMAQDSGKKFEFAEENDFNGDRETLKQLATESVEIRTIDAPIVERAWGNLLNLPEEEPRLKTGDLSDVVEFGTLEDDEEEDAKFDFRGNWDNSVALERNDDNGSNQNAEIIARFDVAQECENRGNGENNAETLVALKENDCDEPNDNVGKEVGGNSEVAAFDEEFNDEPSESEEKEEENVGEVDAALEARLLQSLKIWEDAKEKNGLGEESGANNEATGDRWERADAFKEERDGAEWKERANFGGIGETNASLPVERIGGESDLRAIGEIDERNEVGGINGVSGTGEVGGIGETGAVSGIGAVGETDETGAVNGTGKVGETDETGAVGGINEVDKVGDSEKSERKAEDRVFEALKSEYFNEGFLFELGPNDQSGGDGDKKETREREKKTRTRSKSTSKTRRPIVGDDDGSRLWNEANGRRIDDERFWETQLTAERVANRSVSDEEAETEAAVDWKEEFVSLEDRAYEQILQDCWETTNDFSASDEYLSELSLLEQEIEEEANLIRRIRNIHLKLRSVRTAVGRKRRREAEEKNVASTRNEDEAASADVEREGEALNYRR